METVTKKLYEGMFLVDSVLAASDWEGVLGFIQSLLDKVGADTISVRKWNENRLAYEINHKSRGTYILTYFRLEGSQVSVLEREVQLTEKLMRVLILNVEHMTEEDLQKATPAEKIEKKLAESEAKAAAPVVDESKEDKKPADEKPEDKKAVAPVVDEPKEDEKPADEKPAEPEPVVEAPSSDQAKPEAVTEATPSDEDKAKPEPAAETEDTKRSGEPDVVSEPDKKEQ
ncbi:MAG: 30S ribosomal protein S6 [Planctomycetes bacterium]|nr:30S ribosomal protein S6 [Planctomycetota bacterium]